MQVMLKLGREWWLLPTSQEFTKKELAPYLDVPNVGVLPHGKSVRFFDLQSKAKVISVLSLVKEAAQHGVKPTLSSRDGASIAFYRPRKVAQQAKSGLR